MCVRSWRLRCWLTLLLPELVQRLGHRFGELIPVGRHISVHRLTPHNSVEPEEYFAASVHLYTFDPMLGLPFDIIWQSGEYLTIPAQL